jgi:transposase
MPRGRKPLTVKDWGEETTKELRRLAKSRTEEKRRVERASLLVYMLDHPGISVQKAAPELKVNQGTLQRWIHRYNASALAGLGDAPGRGRPADYTDEDAAFVLKTARTKPPELGLPFALWTMDDLTRYLKEHYTKPICRTTLWKILHRNGFRWKEQRSWFSPLKRPEFRHEASGSA